MAETSPQILGHNYIGGRRSAQGPGTLRSLAADGGAAHAATFHAATPAEIDAAVQAASQAYPAYRALPIETRAAFLENIAQALDALGDDFIAEVSRETALPAARLQGERARTSNQMRLFARVLRRGDFHGARIDTALPDRQPLPRPDLRQARIGVGPVAVFGASNFPLAFSVAGGDTASALAAGCPVVVKAHSGHLVTSERVADAIERAREQSGVPAGVFNMVYGEAEVGGALVQAPGIKAVGFTGSLRAGRALFDLASRRPEPIPVFAEMSSINPIVLLPEALQQRGEAIARDLAASVSMGCGQFCTSPGLVVGVDSPALRAFAEHLATAFRALPAQVMLNPGILKNYTAGVARLQGLAGVKSLATGASAPERATAQVFQADPALLADPHAPLEEEVFGPTTVLVALPDKAALKAFLGRLHGQLTITLIATDAEVVKQGEVVALLEEKAGRLLLNGFPTGVEVCDAMVHGGPYPATSDARGTSVGTLAMDRYLRPVCYQNYPDALLPPALQNANPLKLLRLVNGEYTRDPL